MTYLPEEHTFSKDHLWIKMFEGNIYVGFTNHFLHKLGKIDVVDIREGISFKKGEICGIIYGKGKSQNMIMPVSGTIISVNMNSFIDPAVFIHEPYKYWVIIIDIKDLGDLKKLLSPAQYKKLINPLQPNDI